MVATKKYLQFCLFFFFNCELATSGLYVKNVFLYANWSCMEGENPTWLQLTLRA